MSRKLLHRHFAEPLEAADLHFPAAGELGLQKTIPVRVVARVEHLCALRDAEERRHREIKMAVADKVRQLAIEEGDEQRGDVGAVHVGVRHDDDLAVAQILLAVARAGSAAERLQQVG